MKQYNTPAWLQVKLYLKREEQLPYSSTMSQDISNVIAIPKNIPKKAPTMVITLFRYELIRRNYILLKE